MVNFRTHVVAPMLLALPVFAQAAPITWQFQMTASPIYPNDSALYGRTITASITIDPALSGKCDDMPDGDTWQFKCSQYVSAAISGSATDGTNFFVVGPGVVNTKMGFYQNWDTNLNQFYVSVNNRDTYLAFFVQDYAGDNSSIFSDRSDWSLTRDVNWLANGSYTMTHVMNDHIYYYGALNAAIIIKDGVAVTQTPQGGAHDLPEPGFGSIFALGAVSLAARLARRRKSC